MKVKKLTLNNFRCFEKVELDFNSGMNVIVGVNGVASRI